MKTLEQPFSFGFKVIAKPGVKNSSNDIFAQDRYECTTGGHFKFYEIILEKDPHIGGAFRIKTQYGKINTFGTTDLKSFSTYNKASLFYLAKTREKLKKDYIKVQFKHK